jgi:hypothetical protein
MPSAEMGYTVDARQQATGYLEKYSMINLAQRWLLNPVLVGGYIGRWREIRCHYANGPAFGGLVGTARAFARFLQDQLRPRSAVLGELGRRLLYERQRTIGGRVTPMTLGWHVRDDKSGPMFYKEGAGGGFHVMMRLDPAQGRGSVLMTNATAFDVGKALDRLDPAGGRYT